MDDSGIESETRTSNFNHNKIRKETAMKEKNIAKEYIRSNLANGFIKPSKSCKLGMKLEMDKAGDDDEVVYYDKKTGKSGSINMLPLQRLSIPNVKLQQPLVEWESDESDETINFYGTNSMDENKSNKKHQDLIDTFSIEELSISDDDENDDLNLVSPKSFSLNNTSFSCCRCYTNTETSASCVIT